MVKKERIIKKIEEKKDLKLRIQRQIETQERQLVSTRRSIEDLDLEISLLEGHVKKMEG